MIGQKQLIEQVNNLADQHRFPRFVIICGSKGSGRKELCKYIAETLNVFWCFEPDCKVETVRNAITDAYKVYDPTLYIFPDADSMSIQARNSLLKVTEEPPNNAYFIMTLESIDNTLSTIRSRATVFNMDAYTMSEIFEYVRTLTANKENDDIITELCSTPGDVNYLLGVGVTEFYGYVNKVFDNIAVVEGANAFKIGLKLCLKDNTEGYDFKMFLIAFKGLCWKAYKETQEQKFLTGIIITQKALSKCVNKSINKQMVFDTWMLAIRKEWLEWK